MIPTVIVAGGPSLALAQVRLIGKASSLARCRVVAVNDAVFPCWFADTLFASDRDWWIENAGVPWFPGRRVSVEPTPFEDVEVLKRELSAIGQPFITGFDERPGYVRTGENSGYGAVHEAAKVTDNIILVAFDFSDDAAAGLKPAQDGAREHWFGKHEGQMDRHSNVGRWREHFRELTTILAGRGVRIRNASLKSTIDWLPRFDLANL